MRINSTGKEIAVAIKEYDGEKLSGCFYEIINNSRIIEKHPYIVPLRAIQYDFEEITDKILKVRLLIELREG